jgi:L-arabinose isomerase
MRMIANEVDVVRPEHAMPKFPVARALWVPRPDFKKACHAWILAGGAHHTSFARALGAAELEDFARMAGLEFVRIGHGTDLHALRNELRWNDAAYRAR